MSGALLAYASRGAATGPLRAVLLAGLVNRTLGGAFVAPWEVDELTPDVLDPILALAVDLPDMRKGLGTIEAKKDAIRRAHSQKVH